MQDMHFLSRWHFSSSASLVVHLVIFALPLAVAADGRFGTTACFFRHALSKLHYHNKNQSIVQRPVKICMASLPDKVEDWGTDHVQEWLHMIGYSQYAPGFASDGIDGIDGDRLVYLGTPDQLDHIEWHLGLLGVVEKDQVSVSKAIEVLVAEGVDASLAVLNVGSDEGTPTSSKAPNWAGYGIAAGSHCRDVIQSRSDISGRQHLEQDISKSRVTSSNRKGEEQNDFQI